MNEVAAVHRCRPATLAWLISMRGVRILDAEGFFKLRVGDYRVFYEVLRM
jgi:hypothetical protein